MSSGEPTANRLAARRAVAFTVMATVALAAALLVGCGSTNTGSQTTTAKFATYTNATYGFSISRPTGWRQETNPPSFMAAHPTCDFAVFWFKPRPDGATQEGLSVGVCGWSNPLTPAQTKAQWRRILKTLKRYVGREYNPGFRLARIGTTPIGGQPAILMHGRYTAAPRHSLDQYWLYHDGILYMVTLSGSASDFASVYRGLPDTFSLR